MTRKKRRLVLIGMALCLMGAAAGLALFALREQIVFFYTPSDIVQKMPRPGVHLRIGGLVKEGSLERLAGSSVRFTVTDRTHDVPLFYTGLLPDLLREGQGVVAEGILEPSGQFRADNVLAKHDEKYMPRDVADALKKQGVWQGEQTKPQKP